MGKDYVLFPLLTGPFFVTTLTANLAANLIRNVWSYAIIFCGHFPDGAEVFTEEQLENETQGEWYLRQLLGSANFTGSRLMHVMSGSLGYQIEHHLFPDLPSNRYPEIAERVTAICEKYDLPYTTGPFPKQFWQVHPHHLAARAAEQEVRRGAAGPRGRGPAARERDDDAEPRRPWPARRPDGPARPRRPAPEPGAGRASGPRVRATPGDRVVLRRSGVVPEPVPAD